MSVVSKLRNAIQRKLLNAALRIIKRHMEKQDGISLLLYDRKTDGLAPVVWRARSITQQKNGKAPGETNSWPALKSLCDYQGKIVLDVGANSGGVAKRFSEEASEVFALEPHPGNYASLLDQIKIRNLSNIKPFQMAASNFNGESELVERESHGIHSLGPHNRGKVISKIPIQVQKLDDFWLEHITSPVALLKIDVEGFETEVLEGAGDLLRNKRIGAVLFEFSPRIHKIRGIDLDAPVSLLRSFGYEVYNGEGRLFDLDPTEYPKVCDLIAVPTNC